MKAYIFCHNWLSDTQKGVQAFHMGIELGKKWLHVNSEGQKAFWYREWAWNHRTAVFLKGGNSDRLKYLEELFGKSEYPWAAFYEDTASLNNSITSVGIVLPELFNNKAGRKWLIEIAGDMRPGGICPKEHIDAEIADILLKAHTV